MSTVSFLASPKGRRSGFITLDDGNGGSIALTILPKAWAATLDMNVCYSHEPGRQTLISVYETQKFSIQTPPSVIGNLIENVAESSSHGELLSISLEPFQGEILTASEDSNFESLARLMALARRTRSSLDDRSYAGYFSESVTRLIKQKELVELASAELFKTSPQFSTKTDTLLAPKGRVSSKDVAYSQITSWPKIESTFDELSYDTPRLQILAVALKTIVVDRLPQWISSLAPNIKASAVQLSQHLRNVSVVQPGHALLMAQRLKLSPSDQAWCKINSLASEVIRGSGLTPGIGEGSQRNLSFSISTEKFWEECLELGLQRLSGELAVNSDGVSSASVTVSAPWARLDRAPFEESTDLQDSTDGSSERYPDFVLHQHGRVLVIDAKYKLIGRANPSSADANQMFAYSHLTSMLGAKPEAVALLYPNAPSQKTRLTELRRMPDFEVPLWLAHVDFPSPGDLKRNSSWQEYLDRLASQLAYLSTALRTR